jgi:hypothetical protein
VVSILHESHRKDCGASGVWTVSGRNCVQFLCFYVYRDIVLDMASTIADESHSHDRALNAQNWPAHPDGPMMVTAHDRDIAAQPDFLDRLFEQLPRGL